MHALQSTEYCPKRLFDELYERPLLLLGNKFPDWHTRLFLRMTRKTPLYHRDVPKQYFADSEAIENPELNFYLKKFTTNTVLIEDLDPTSFVTVLAEKWLDKYTEEATQPASKGSYDRAEKPMPKNAVFISYCATTINEDVSIDSQVALSIRDALESAGIAVWLDKHQLHGGDEYARKIQRYIKTCSIFMPLISETTESRSSGFFRKEWNWALNRLPEFTGADRKFLFPVVIDNTNPYHASIPEEFKEYQFTSLADQTPTENFITNVKLIYEKSSKEIKGRIA